MRSRTDSVNRGGSLRRSDCADHAGLRRAVWALLVIAAVSSVALPAAFAQAPLAPAAAAPAPADQQPWWEKVVVGDLVSAAIIVLAMFFILWLANRLHNRFVALLAARSQRGTQAEQENRARTLVSVLHNALRTVVIAGGLIMVLNQIHISVGPLLGGVAVVGLAVAFGAQSLIKDYFTGFLILLEQQYMLGDVVKIGTTTGKVERITMRLTVLRDSEGAVHFIPHGQITTVSNQTHGWSQALFDLQVASGEPVERVREIFMEAARELRADETYGPMTLADAEMLGVDSLGEATYSVKFTLRTLPQKRADVRREMLRRLKERFTRHEVKVIVPA
jgi:small conductance mechanosensitive channel